MRYGEDWWTPEEAEDGVVPHTAVFDPISGVYREIIEDDEDDVWQGPASMAVAAWSGYTREEDREIDENV